VLVLAALVFRLVLPLLPMGAPPPAPAYLIRSVAVCSRLACDPVAWRVGDAAPTLQIAWRTAQAMAVAVAVTCESPDGVRVAIETSGPLYLYAGDSTSAQRACPLARPSGYWTLEARVDGAPLIRRRLLVVDPI
jgi:hypothetical protein